MHSYKEIQEQIARLQDEASIARKAELKAAIVTIREQMALYGITVADLGGTVKPQKAKRTTAQVAAKYRDPASGKTWSGRGRAPLWIKGDLTAYLIR